MSPHAAQTSAAVLSPVAPHERNVILDVLRGFALLNSIFSFLFGLGFTIQLTRAAERGRNVASVYLRRIGILPSSRKSSRPCSPTASTSLSSVPVRPEARSPRTAV